MKHAIIPLIALLSVCGPPEPLMAQQDSSRLDVGYFTLNKAFSQQISIKGSDLEMMPFTNLSDAIRAWLYGAFCVPATLQYVVDGNPVVDVNAYSIQDIDEVILVQNAAATMATAPTQAEMVIVKTKRRRGPQGICAAAQTGLVRTDKSLYATATKLFQNYYLGGYRNLKKISFGVSGNFIRDQFPYAFRQEMIEAGSYLTRWRLNGYFDWRPNDHNRIGITMNYTPQTWGGQQDTTASPATYFALEKGNQHFVLPHLNWRAWWGKGWSNLLEGTYVRSGSSFDDAYAVDTGRNWLTELTAENLKSYQVWVQDRVGYEGRLGGWTIEPSLNISYQQYKNEDYVLYGTTTINPDPSYVINPVGYTTLTGSLFEGKLSDWLLTPTVDLTYKRVLDIEGGAMIHAGGTVSLTGNGRQVYPFATAAVDLLGGKPGRGSLKLFGSVASRTVPSAGEYALADYSNGLDVSFNLPNLTFVASSLPPTPYSLFPTPPVYWIWETGLAYVSRNGRLGIGYNYESRISALIGLGNIGSQPPGYGKFHSSLQHLEIRINILDGTAVSWRTGLNATVMRNRLEFLGSIGEASPPIGDSPNDTIWTWTGGWVNRLQLGRFAAGLDLLYHFNDLGMAGKRSNLATTPNLYVGYRFNLRGATAAEVFAETRGLFVNAYSDLADARQYYTIGANLCL